jgi:hypothetical protein
LFLNNKKVSFSGLKVKSTTLTTLVVDYETVDYKIKTIIPELPKSMPVKEPKVTPSG